KKGVPKETRETLEIFAPQIAIAIENARLYRRLQEQMQELKRSHALLSRAEKFSFLGNIAARLAHEIKNPMTAIGTFIQMLPHKFDDEEYRGNFYTIALEETNRVNNLISELLDLVNTRESQFELNDLHGLIDKMVLLISAQSNSKNIKIVCQYDQGIEKVWLDSEKMKQIILNLLSNAVEFTPEGGRIDISTMYYDKEGSEETIRVEIKERVTRLIDAIKLKEPDRVPVAANPGHIPARYSGYTIKEVMYDSEKVVKAWQKYINDFDLDILVSAGAVRCGKALDILDAKMYKWPGHGLTDNVSTQYVEGEYLKADEWEALKDDPSDFRIRTYLPRIYGAAEPLRRLPPLGSIGNVPGGLVVFSDPEVQAAFKALGEAGKEEAERRKIISELDRKGMESGLPAFYMGAMGGSAPLDHIGASLRGTKGTVMDMFRQPQKLIEFMEYTIPDTIKRGVASANAIGNPVMFMPLHRGADGFMSEKQFHTFYWPYLKRVIMGYIEEGLVPRLFAEGGYNTRLEIIKDLPKGKVIWHFDQTDMTRAKEVLGDVACLMGNVPASLLVTGTPAEVKAHCKQLIETAGKGGGYIMAPGATADNTKQENLSAMLEAAKEYGVYRE
ncbi:uroporphyrinogen decarboxylase family protein, partial [Thermodesulfobacteriota bacterium]